MKKWIRILILAFVLAGLGGVLLSRFYKDESSSFDTPILLHVNGETYEPYVNLLFAQTWGGDGWVFEDCLRFRHMISGMRGELPELTPIPYDESFEISYQDDVSYTSTSIFNEAAEEIYKNTDLSTIRTLEPGTYYICIQVTKLGNYVLLKNDHEKYGYECVYKFVISSS